MKHWNKFLTSLMKTLSLNMVFGITIAICVYGGYKLGSFLDERYLHYPLYTLIGTFIGIGLGAGTVYSMVQKYFKSPGQGKHKTTKPAETVQTDLRQDPIIDISLEDVRQAIREFSDKLPKGVYRTILVLDDNSIDFNQLTQILGGIPSKKFYMSKETYDLFEDDEKHIAVEMDLVQKAVDLYVKEKKEYPMLQFDPLHKVNYYQLRQEQYLKSEPKTQFYITDLDGLVTHIKPQKKRSSHL